MVEPSKIIFLIYDTLPQKEDRVLLYIGYHSIPEYNTTHMRPVQHKGGYMGAAYRHLGCICALCMRYISSFDWGGS